MVIAQHHADFGLAVMIVNDHAELFGEPTDDLWVERFASAADDTQLATYGVGELGPGVNQQAKGRRRAGQVVEPVLGDNPAGALRGERAVMEQRGPAARQWPGHCVIQAIGPAGVGEVSETVVFAQVD